MDKSITCCFTGHRPKSLPWGYNEKSKNFKLFKKKLIDEINKAVDLGYTNFISGMALGIDMIAAEIILKLKKKSPNIKLECAIPCINQYKSWPDGSIKRYNKIIKKADKITLYLIKNILMDVCRIGICIWSKILVY